MCCSSSNISDSFYAGARLSCAAASSCHVSQAPEPGASSESPEVACRVPPLSLLQDVGWELSASEALDIATTDAVAPASTRLRLRDVRLDGDPAAEVARLSLPRPAGRLVLSTNDGEVAEQFDGEPLRLSALFSAVAACGWGSLELRISDPRLADDGAAVDDEGLFVPRLFCASLRDALARAAPSPLRRLSLGKCILGVEEAAWVSVAAAAAWRPHAHVVLPSFRLCFDSVRVSSPEDLRHVAACFVPGVVWRGSLVVGDAGGEDGEEEAAWYESQQLGMGGARVWSQPQLRAAVDALTACADAPFADEAEAEAEEARDAYDLSRSRALDLAIDASMIVIDDDSSVDTSVVLAPDTLASLCRLLRRNVTHRLRLNVTHRLRLKRLDVEVHPTCDRHAISALFDSAGGRGTRLSRLGLPGLSPRAQLLLAESLSTASDALAAALTELEFGLTQCPNAAGALAAALARPRWRHIAVLYRTHPSWDDLVWDETAGAADASARLLAALLPLGDTASLDGLAEATAADVTRQGQCPLRTAPSAERCRNAARGAAAEAALVGVIDACTAATVDPKPSAGAHASRPRTRFRPAATESAALVLCLLCRTDGAAGRGSLRRCATSGGAGALLRLLSLPRTAFCDASAAKAAIHNATAAKMAGHAATLVLMIAAAEVHRMRDAASDATAPPPPTITAAALVRVLGAGSIASDSLASDRALRLALLLSLPPPSLTEAFVAAPSLSIIELRALGFGLWAGPELRLFPLVDAVIELLELSLPRHSLDYQRARTLVAPTRADDAAASPLSLFASSLVHASEAPSALRDAAVAAAVRLCGCRELLDAVACAGERVSRAKESRCETGRIGPTFEARMRRAQPAGLRALSTPYLSAPPPATARRRPLAARLRAWWRRLLPLLQATRRRLRTSTLNLSSVKRPLGHLPLCQPRR